MIARNVNSVARTSGSAKGVAPEPCALREHPTQESAAVGQSPTDGATGQPVRANPAPAIYRNDCASAPDRFREAEGLDLGDLEPVDVSPCEEGIAAVEDRAHTAAWHQYLSLPDDN